MFKIKIPFLERKNGPLPASPIRAVIFDLDNTLEDFATAEAIAEATLAEIVAKDTACKPMEFLSTFTEVKRKYNHGKTPLAYSRLHWIEDTGKLLHLKLDADDLERQYWRILRKEVKLYPGAIETLKILKGKGLRLAMLSDSDGIKGLKRKRIKELGLEQFFDAIVTADDIGENKPSLKGFNTILTLLSLSPSACVMVGDHPEFDLAPAKQLGMKTVWQQERIVFDRAYPFVDSKIRRIQDLLELPLF